MFLHFQELLKPLKPCNFVHHYPVKQKYGMQTKMVTTYSDGLYFLESPLKRLLTCSQMFQTRGPHCLQVEVQISAISHQTWCYIHANVVLESSIQNHHFYFYSVSHSNTPENTTVMLLKTWRPEDNRWCGK